MRSLDAKTPKFQICSLRIHLGDTQSGMVEGPPENLIPGPRKINRRAPIGHWRTANLSPDQTASTAAIL
jgi:hypothetical protein